jgi:flagellar biosynthesis protein FlhA
MLYIVAGTIGLLGLFTPIGLWRTLPMAALLAFGGFRLSRIARELETTEEIPIEQAEEQDFRNPEHAFHLLQVDPIEFEFGYGLIPLADVQQGGDLLDRVVMIRRQLAVEMGFVVPMIRIRDNIQLDPNQYIIKIKGNPVASGSLYLDMFLAMGSSEDDGGIRGIKTREPAFGLPALWIDETEKERAEMAGFTVVDPPSVVATHLTEIIKHHAYELLGRQETQAMINFVKEQHAALVEELTPQKLSVGEIQKVLSKLLKEKVSIRNLAQIFETLADHAVYTKDADLLAEYVRQSLARQITRQYVREDNELQVITVGPGLEKVLKEHIQETEQGSYLALDPMTTQTVFQNIQKEIGRVSAMGIQAVFLTAPSVRMFLRQLVERVAPQAAVLSYNELESDVAIQSVGVVNI